jgi:iron complex transport system substrate-binding protein
MFRVRVAALTGALLLGGLAGCSASEASSSAEPSASPRTVTDPSGKTVVIPSDAQRVFGMYTTDLDYALTLELGLAPVQSIRQGSVGFPDFFPQAPIAGIEPLVNYPDPQFEKIAGAAPDVIVNGLGYEGGPDAAKLSAIAPTFTYNGFDGDWRDDFTALADAFGKEQVAEEFLQQVSARTAEVKSKVDSLGEAPVVAYGWANEDGSGGFNGSAPTTLGAQIFDEVGITSPKAVGKEWTEISHEKIAELDDVDLIMIAVETDTDQQAVLDRVKKDPIWSQLPAVRAGRLVAVNNELSYASPHAHLAFLDVVEKNLALLQT